MDKTSSGHTSTSIHRLVPFIKSVLPAFVSSQLNATLRHLNHCSHSFRLLMNFEQATCLLRIPPLSASGDMRGGSITLLSSSMGKDESNPFRIPRGLAVHLSQKPWSLAQSAWKAGLLLEFTETGTADCCREINRGNQDDSAKDRRGLFARPAHARVDNLLICIASTEKSMIRTRKGTVKRQHLVCKLKR